ncbi:MAG: acyltransferase [Lachnospiraceae bacterium]|nr:acyltransferase [Lachnospiraceae bacterium]
MRKYYLDNVRWFTVVIVVLYHVLYMYNGEGIQGVVGKITDLDVQYYDVFQYIVYPWIMVLLFMVSGISSRLYLEKHSHKEFLAGRTRKLLVPSTIGILVFHFIQGYLNITISGVVDHMPPVMKVIVCLACGISILWYIQVLWVFSLVLVLIRKVEKDRLYKLCGKAGLPVLIALSLVAFGAAQILNTPVIVLYRFGLYGFVFLLGYFVLSHDEVVEVLKKWFPLFLLAAAGLGTAFCLNYFGQNYAGESVNRTILFVAYGYFASLAIIGGMAKYGDVSNAFTQWMSKRSFGLYVFHYLCISVVAVYVAMPGLVPPLVSYLLSLIAGFGGAYLLNAVISRIPFFRWAVLGIKKERKTNA